MKILMTADAVGGVWTYAMELAAALAEDGVEIVLAVMGPAPTARQQQEAAALQNLTLEHGAYRLEWMDEPWEDVRAAGQWLLELEESHRPEVIHLNGYAHGVLPWRAPLLMVAHSCVLSWWQAVKHEPAPPRWTHYRHAVACGLASADRIIAPSADMLQTINRLYGPFPNTRVIHNARHAARFAPQKKEPFLFCAGRMWDEAKNLAALEAVAAEVHWPIYIAGETNGPLDRPALKCLGKLAPAEVAGWMARAAIYALPARYEPFGLSVLEAALSGCALVLGDIPSLREIWGDAARFVPPEDSACLRQAINDLIAHPGQQNDLAAAAGRRARIYAPRRMADAYLKEYRRMMDAAVAVGSAPLADHSSYLKPPVRAECGPYG